MGRGGLELVDDVDDGLHTPFADGHIEGREECESANALSRGEGQAHLLQGVGVRRTDVQSKSINADTLGVVDVVGPLVAGLAAGDTNL